MVYTLIVLLQDHPSKTILCSEKVDPEVRIIPQGSQDSIWGKPTCLHGQIGLFALLQDSLNPQNVRTFHEAGE